jgi:hypothetical protein
MVVVVVCCGRDKQRESSESVRGLAGYERGRIDRTGSDPEGVRLTGRTKRFQQRCSQHARR